MVGVFLKPLIAAFGGSRGGASRGFTVVALSAAAFGILWGYFADRKPTRRFLVMAAAALAASLLLLSQMRTRWQYVMTALLPTPSPIRASP